MGEKKIINSGRRCGSSSSNSSGGGGGGNVGDVKINLLTNAVKHLLLCNAVSLPLVMSN